MRTLTLFLVLALIVSAAPSFAKGGARAGGALAGKGNAAAAWRAKAGQAGAGGASGQAWQGWKANVGSSPGTTGEAEVSILSTRGGVARTGVKIG